MTTTNIDGIRNVVDDHYAVTFTLYVEADTPQQASDRAMAVRSALVDGDTDTLDFYWHLHDHDGC